MRYNKFYIRRKHGYGSIYLYRFLESGLEKRPNQKPLEELDAQASVQTNLVFCQIVYILLCHCLGLATTFLSFSTPLYYPLCSMRQ